jgi:peptidyl-prolyl cis-trans isomerase C
MKKMIPVLAVLAVAFLGCPAEKAKTTEDSKAVKAEATGDNVAVVGEHVINTTAFQAEVDKLPQQHRQWTQTPQGRKYIVDNLVEGFLIEDEAKRRGVDKRPDVVQKIDNYRRQLLKDGLMEDILKGETHVTDADAQKYYDGHPAEFKQPERVKVLDMVLAKEDEARAVVAQLNKGADFAALAREKSVDPYTKERSGDLPEFTKDMRQELYADAAAAKKPGQIIGPVKTSQGFHVMKFVKKIPPEEKAFDQVKDSLKARLQAMKRQEAYNGFLKSLRESAKVSVNDEFIAGPKTPPPPQQPLPKAVPAQQPKPPAPAAPKGK